MLAVENEGNSIFDSLFIAKTKSLTLELKKIPEVVKSISPATIQIPLKTPFGVTTVPLLNPKKVDRKRDSIKIASDPRIYKSLVSDDYTALGVFLKTDPDMHQKASKALDDSIKEVVEKYDFSVVHYGGKANLQNEFERLIKGEIVLYISLSLALLLIVLIIIFRKFWAVVVALVSVIIGAVIFMGFLGVLGKPLNLMSMLFPPLMLIVGISDICLLYTSPSPRDQRGSRMPSSA